MFRSIRSIVLALGMVAAPWPVFAAPTVETADTPLPVVGEDPNTRAPAVIIRTLTLLAFAWSRALGLAACRRESIDAGPAAYANPTLRVEPLLEQVTEWELELNMMEIVE